MTILAIVKLLLGFADGLMGYLNAQQQQEAGAAIVNAKNLQAAQEAHRNAEAARAVIGDNLRRNPDWMPNTDPNRRD